MIGDNMMPINPEDAVQYYNSRFSINKNLTAILMIPILSTNYNLNPIELNALEMVRSSVVANGSINVTDFRKLKSVFDRNKQSMINEFPPISQEEREAAELDPMGLLASKLRCHLRVCNCFIELQGAEEQIEKINSTIRTTTGNFERTKRL